MEALNRVEKKENEQRPGCEIHAVKRERGQLTENMHTYWQERSKTFGFDAEFMLNVQGKIKPFLTEETKKVLDVGTGTGVIAAACAELGLDVTAIDLCSEMIKRAEKNLADIGLSAKFMETQADELPFDDDSFDIVINRNLTWALEEPEKVLRQWKRVLRPGGLLIYFDANQYYYYYNEEDRKNREKMIEMTGKAHEERSKEKVDYSLCNDTAYYLPLSKLNRPTEWDDIVLPKEGFAIIKEDIDYPQNLLPLGIAKGWSTQFMIVAVNMK